MSGDGAGDRSAARRGVDPERAGLAGIGAEQDVAPGSSGHGDELEAPGPYDVWDRTPAAHGDLLGGTTYYDRPVLKEPVWIWAVPAYFHVGGAAGAAALLGAVAQPNGGLDRLVGRCRWIAAAGTTVGTGLLVADLGRPERFLNMLRVLRPTSPMSVGSWILAATSGAATVAALAHRRDGWVGALGDLAGATAGLLGAPLAGYTAVLVTNTAVPAWQSARRSLPLMFQASGALAASSLLGLGDLDEREERVVRLFAVAGAVGELAMGELVEREVGGSPRSKRPYEEGASGAMWRAAKVATAASLLTWLLPGRSRGKRVAAGALGTVGTLLVRFAVWQVGKASARDPRATFTQQRAGRGAAEVTGRAAVVGPGGRRATDR